MHHPVHNKRRGRMPLVGALPHWAAQVGQRGRIDPVSELAAIGKLHAGIFPILYVAELEPRANRLAKHGRIAGPHLVDAVHVEDVHGMMIRRIQRIANAGEGCERSTWIFNDLGTRRCSAPNRRPKRRYDEED